MAFICPAYAQTWVFYYRFGFMSNRREFGNCEAEGAEGGGGCAELRKLRANAGIAAGLGAVNFSFVLISRWAREV